MRTPSLLILMVSLLFTGCPEEDPPIIPPPPVTQCEYPAGNRNYSWRLDTVAWFPSTLGGIHAFSDSDAYLMGYIGEGKAPWNIFMAKHWNGSSWTTNTNGSYEEIKHYANDVTGDNFYMVSVGYWAIGSERAGLAEFDNRSKKWKGHQFQTQGELRSVWTDGKGYFIAVGDNGMVYIKDGYSSSWAYQKVPTDFSLYKIAGVSKNEVYVLGYKSLSGVSYPQIWKYFGNNWIRILDDLDTTGTAIKIPETEHMVGDIYAERCSIADSLRLYIIGWESNLFESKGASLQFKKTNLTDYGLYLNSLHRTALRIFGFNLNDIWVCGERYSFYHWNGTDFQPMTILGIPDKDVAPSYRRMRKTATGKIFFPLEISSQVYVVAQGTPK